MEMTQAERLTWLINVLGEENSGFMTGIGPSLGLDKKKLLRGLMNVRGPLPLPQEFLEIQDAFLQEEVAERGIVDSVNLPTVPGFSKLAVWRGDITTLAADAIVNAANSRLLGCFIPCHQCIDNAIHTFSGLQLRRECHELMQRQGREEPAGHAKITSAYNLPSRFVLHTVGPIIHGAVTENDKELLASCYSSCLELAEKRKLRSVVFCCISTGEYRFPRKPAAEIAVNTVLSFMNARTHVEKVIFNVFTREDQEIYRHEFNRLH